MKIAQVASVYPPYAGGLGNVVSNLAEYLSLAKEDVTVFTPRYRSSDLGHLQSSYQIERLNPWLRRGKASLLPQLFWRLQSFDVIDLHLPFIGSTLVIYLLKKFYGSQVHLVVHYHMDLVGKNWLYRKAFKLQQWLMKKELLAADRVIVSSQDYLVNSHLSGIYQRQPSKFSIIPSGVDSQRFALRRPEENLLNRYGLTGHQVILFVGALDDTHYFKGVNYLLKAFSLLSKSEARLIIVGEGNLRPVYQDLAIEYDLADKVIFTGFVPDAHLPKYYNLADVLVLPSIDSSESFGSVILEAMASGVPVIASDLPGVREVLGFNEYGLLVKPKNAEALAKKIDRLLSDEALAKKMSAASLARIQASYSWPIVVDQLIKVYQELLHQPL